jgi:phosphohistidine swiveling domain-containing protein
LDKTKKIAEFYAGVWEKAPAIELFDPCGEKLLEEEMGKHGLALTPEELNALISPLEPTLAQKERIDMHGIIKSGGKGLEEHAGEYCYMQNSWAKGIRLDEDYFRKELEEYRENPDALEDEVRELGERLEGLGRKREATYSQKEIPEELRNVFELFSQLAHWREERKGKVQLTNYHLNGLLKAVSNASGVDAELLKFASLDEIISLDLSREYLGELRERKHSGAVYTSGKWIYGKEAEEIIKRLESTFDRSVIKGRPASGGRAKGRVKLIATYEDFKKMKEGDVLVTLMTRPEHVPIMKKAAAIITDEGGLTCHAAIVSRELGIPCIVGTQVATMVLKDGELVEVDADSGVVKRHV